MPKAKLLQFAMDQQGEKGRAEARPSVLQEVEWQCGNEADLLEAAVYLILASLVTGQHQAELAVLDPAGLDLVCADQPEFVVGFPVLL